MSNDWKTGEQKCPRIGIIRPLFVSRSSNCAILTHLCGAIWLIVPYFGMFGAIMGDCAAYTVMPTKAHAEEYDAIVRAVSGFPNGAAIRDLRVALPDYARRTLQRRLDDLIDSGMLISEGAGRGYKYLVAAAADKTKRVPDKGNADWLTKESIEIIGLVNRPLGSRKPVPYHIEFIESYVPNQTPYLMDELCRKLTDMGRVGENELPAGTYMRQVMDRLIIDLSWNSSRLEGNTYSLLDTERLLEAGESAEGKDAKETQMILNHKSAIEMLAEEAGSIAFNRYTICNLHALLSQNLLPDPAGEGRLRSNLIGIGQSVYEPLQVPQQIEMYFDLMLKKAEAITDPIEQSFFIMVHLPYLQPFEDVNKRVSRLAANIPLVKKNLCPLSFVDVDQEDYVRATLAIYELNRVEYLRDVFVRAYARSCARYSTIRQVLGEPDPFRLRYRKQIGEFIQSVVTGSRNKRAASQWITSQVKASIPKEDQTRFQEVVETELGGLHEGNIARYRLRLSEYNAWKAGWR